MEVSSIVDAHGGHAVGLEILRPATSRRASDVEARPRLADVDLYRMDALTLRLPREGEQRFRREDYRSSLVRLRAACLAGAALTGAGVILVAAAFSARPVQSAPLLGQLCGEGVRVCHRRTPQR